MQPKLKTHLFEIQQACGHLAQFATGRSRADYETDIMLRSAIERQFMIVGEALNLALKIDASLAQQITNTRSIIGFRNVLVHGYAVVNNDQVWNILENDLALLRQEVDALLAQP